MALEVEARAAVSDQVAALALRPRMGKRGRWSVRCSMRRGDVPAWRRPLVCRTYGFYADGADGKHCDKVSQAVAAHPEAAIVWGHEPAIFVRPKGLGDGADADRPVATLYEEDAP